MKVISIIKSNKFGVLVFTCITFYLILQLFNINSAYMSIGDESTYYVSVQRLFDGFIDNNNHPLLAKTIWYFIVIGFYLVTGTDHAAYWRMGTILFSLGTLFVFYRISRFIFSKSYSLLCCLLLAFDPIFFTLSRILMLDIPCLFFLLSSVFFFFSYMKSKEKSKFFLCALFLGLSLATKLFALPLLVAFPLLYMKENFRTERKFSIFPSEVLIFVVIVFLLYAFGNLIYFFKHPQVNFFEYTFLQFASQPGFGLNISLSSPAWSWFIIPQVLPLYRVFDGSLVQTIVVFQNPLLFLLTLPTILMTLFLILQSKEKNKIVHNLLIILLSLYLPWIIPIRSTYYYYSIIFLPFIILLFVNLITNIKRSRQITIGISAFYVLCFAIAYPLLIGVGIPFLYEDTVNRYSLYKFGERNSINCQLCYPLRYPSDIRK